MNDEKIRRMMRELFPEAMEMPCTPDDSCPLCREMGMETPGTVETFQFGPLTVSIKEVKPN